MNHVLLPGSLTASYTDTQYTTNALLPKVLDTYYDQSNGKRYVFLKVTSATGIAAKLCGTALTTDKTNGFIQLPALTNNLPFAGCRVSGATTVAQNEYGWFQIGGSATLTADAAGTTAEAYVTISNATAGNVEALAGTAAVDAANAFGIAQTTTTAGDVVVILNKGNAYGL